MKASNHLRQIGILLLFIISVKITLAEGIGSFYSNQNDTVAQRFKLNVYNSNSGTGSIMNCQEFKRIYIHINNPVTEKICLGFKPNANNCYYRIIDPLGNIVTSTLIPVTGSGSIDYYKKAIDGPSNCLLIGGYAPIIITPTLTGDYYVEFNRSNNFTTQTLTNWGLDLWDITVCNVTSLPNMKINGRVFCKTWNFNTITSTGTNGDMKSKIYAYTNDSIIHKIDFNGMEGANFTTSMNSFGYTNSLAVSLNRKSIVGDASLTDTLGEYKLFLNLPDTNYFKTSKIPLQISFSNPLLTGCSSASTTGSFMCINLITNKVGVVELLLDINGVPGYQGNTSDTMLTQNVNPGINCFSWSGLDGNQNYVTSISIITVTAVMQIGITHIPLYDVENNPNGFIVQTLFPATLANIPMLYFDDTNIGGGTSNLIGCTTPCHPWNTTIGNGSTINTWFFGSSSQVTTTLQPHYSPKFNLLAISPTCYGQTNGVIMFNNSLPYILSSIDSIGIFLAPLTSPNAYSLASASGTLNNLSAGNYFINIKNTYGCLTQKTITVTQPASLTISFGSIKNVSCFGLTNASVTALVNGGSPAYTYTWLPLTNNTNSLVNISAGNYTLSTKDSKGCLANKTILISQPTSSLTVIANTTLNTNCSSPNGAIQLFTSGGTLPYSFSWNNGIIISSVTNLLQGVYNYSVTDINNCQTTGSVNVNGSVLPVVTSTTLQNVTCYNGNNGAIIQQINGGLPPFNYWLNNLQVSAANSSNLTAGTYSFLLVDAGGCSYTHTFSINQPNKMLINKVVENACIGQNNGSLEVIITGGTPQYTITLNNNNYLNNPIKVEGLSIGNYFVNVKDQSGCKDTATFHVDINNSTSCNITIPEIFTPNSDSYNDLWEIKGIEFYPNNQVQIFNRWGNKVYDKRGYKNDWAGTPNVNDKTGGDKLPAGTYFVIVDFGSETNTTYKGMLQLMY